MRSRKKLLSVGLIAVASLIGAACGGGDDAATDTTAAAGGVECNGTETIKIARNNWSASAVEVEIFKQLVEANLCNPVEIVDIDENAMFAGMSTGDVDVNLEVWPSGVVAEEQAFIDDGSVANMGTLGAEGLKHEHRVLRVCAQSIGERASGRTTTDDHVVVLLLQQFHGDILTGDKQKWRGLHPATFKTCCVTGSVEPG
ncbi:MAG: hypothetical protein EB132_05330 [Actinobacteria bacterium]|nr:hypothetical protein [Actinomycetota bacterium]